MIKLQKITAVIVAVYMTFTVLFTGCSANTTPEESTYKSGIEPTQTVSAVNINKPDISQEVKLLMWTVGEAPPDTNEVYSEVNKILKQKINATVETRWTTWTDFLQKYQLLFASGEDFDMAVSYIWMDYINLATKNGYYEISDEMLQKFAPNVYAKWDKSWFEQAKVNGKLYMIPGAGLSHANMQVVEIRGDLREKYGLPQLKSLDDFENYLFTIAKNEKEIIALNSSTNDVLRKIFDIMLSGKMTAVGPPNLFYSAFDDASGKVVPFYEIPEYKEYLRKIRKLYETGAIPKNVLSNKVPSGEAFKAGKSASSINSIDDCFGKVEGMTAEHPEWKGEVFDITPADARLPARNHIEVGGIGINANSKNPERALMAIDLFHTDKEIYDLTHYGIAGKSYEAVGDNQYKLIGDPKNYNINTSCAWAWDNSALHRFSATRTQNYKDMLAKQDAVATRFALTGFSFDDSKVKTEYAAVNNVMNNYFAALEAGVVSVEDGFEKAVAKIKQAGIEKITAEINVQAQAYVNK